MAHPELGSRILDGVISAVGPAAKVENEARLEGRNMSMVLAPDKKAQEAIKKAAEEAAAEAAAAAAEGTAPEPTEPDAGVAHTATETQTETQTKAQTKTHTETGSDTSIDTGRDVDRDQVPAAPTEMATVAVPAGDGDERSGESHAEDEDE
jgi:hypothetical protein